MSNLDPESDSSESKDTTKSPLPSWPRTSTPQNSSSEVSGEKPKFKVTRMPFSTKHLRKVSAKSEPELKAETKISSPEPSLDPVAASIDSTESFEPQTTAADQSKQPELDTLSAAFHQVEELEPESENVAQSALPEAKIPAANVVEAAPTSKPESSQSQLLEKQPQTNVLGLVIDIIAAVVACATAILIFTDLIQ